MEVELMPRFPLFGGWSTEFILGYSLPLVSLASHMGGVVLLNFTLSPPLKEVVYDRVETRIVLPEGAHSIQWESKFREDIEMTMDKKMSYLDMSPRPVLVLVHKNVMQDHHSPLLVSYQLPMYSMLREPLMLASAVFAFFMVCMVYVRLDLSISRGPQWQAAQNREAHRDIMQRLGTIFTSRSRALRELESAIKLVSRSGDTEAVAAVKAKVEASLKSYAEEAAALFARLEILPGGSNDLPKLREMESKEHQKKVQLFQYAAANTQCVQKKLKTKEAEMKLKKMEVSLVEAVREVQGIYDSIDFS